MPAVIQPSEITSTPIATTTSSSQQQEMAETLRKQQEELDKKVEELEKREQRINQGLVGEWGEETFYEFIYSLNVSICDRYVLNSTICSNLVDL